MRRCMPMLACAVMALACAAVPSVAGAAPLANRGLTIHATPRHVIAGEPVLIFGRVGGAHRADRPVTLWHRINPRARFTVIGHTMTDANGRYEFTRAEHIVNSNRTWFVRGPRRRHSRTIHERVAAEVTLAASAAEGTTRHPLTFAGAVTPEHRGGRVALQVQRGDANRWRTVRTARIGAGSRYSMTYAWRIAGPRDVRVRFAGDRRNTPAASDPVAIVIDQRQAPHFTIATSDPIVSGGEPATITGTLDRAGTSTPDPGVEIGLYARVPHGGPFRLVQQTASGSDGGYRFTVQDTTNELYLARTISERPARGSAVVFEGVRDTVEMAASATNSTVGGEIAFTGSVAPAKAGHVVYLERLGRDGHWHVAEASTVAASSRFAFHWTFGAAGTRQFRARVLGGPRNVGGASSPITVSVAQPPLAQLPAS